MLQIAGFRVPPLQVAAEHFQKVYHEKVISLAFSFHEC